MAFAHSGQFVFKGGTSLSKAFKIIERFSEDIDILLLAFDNTTEAEREQLMESITALVKQAVSATEARQLKQDRGIRRTTRLNYSRRVPKGAAEFPFLRLELGFAGGARPHATVPITSLLVDAFDAVGRDTTAYEDLSPCNVPVLHPGRTLIEKLSLLHSRVAEAEQIGRPDTPRLWARHYYDVHCLLNHALARELCSERDEFLRLGSDRRRRALAGCTGSHAAQPSVARGPVACLGRDSGHALVTTQASIATRPSG